MTLLAMIRDGPGSAITAAVAADMPEPSSIASSAPSSAAITCSVWRTVALSGRPYAKPDRYWLSGSRRNVVATCTGGTTAPVAGSIAPSAWAASVRGFQVRARVRVIFFAMPSLQDVRALFRLEHVAFQPRDHAMHDLLVVLLQHHRVTVAEDAGFRQDV